MSAVYDNWGRLVGAVLRREDFRRSALRTPSDVSLASSLSSLSASSSFNFISPSDHQFSSFGFSKLSFVGESFTFDQILHATDNFSSSNFIMIALSGHLFYGVLEGRKQVLVKMVDLSSAQYYWFPSRRFYFLKSELEFFAKVSHPKFVPLLGYCLEAWNHKIFLVYKYMSNNDLHTLLFKNTDPAGSPSAILNWQRRLQIAIGVAQALNHLHHECVPPLVHRNVEASSILIDENYDGYLGRNWEVCPQKKERNQGIISKFLGLHLVQRNTHIRYPDQSASDASNATCAYDVYCFGKVLLQLVTGIPSFTDNNNSIAPKSIEDLLPYISTYDKELFLNIMDPSLAMDDHLLNEVWAAAIVAKACLSSSRHALMKNVLKALEDTKLELSTFVSSLFRGQSTQVNPALGNTILHEGSGSEGASHVTTNTITVNSWTVFWNSQHSSVSGIKVVNQNGEIWASPNLIAFSFAELRTSTKNFVSDGLLGEGVFGKVYKGYLPKKYAINSGRQSLLAVKRWKPESFQGFEEWQNEITMLGKLSHPNLIKLQGYCFEDKELLLVYEYMPRGSLDNHLFGRGSIIQPLSWDIRLKILIGAARALAYLHAFKRAVIFRDFNPSSIMLDSSYNAKLSGFGLAKIGPPENDTHVSTRVMGTYGIAAPEYVATGHLYIKSDVYGFGVVMVEVLSGLRINDICLSVKKSNFVEWFKAHSSNERNIEALMDSRLEGRYPARAALKMARLALKCLSTSPEDRPSMKQVVETLEQIESFQKKAKDPGQIL